MYICMHACMHASRKKTHCLPRIRHTPMPPCPATTSHQSPPSFGEWAWWRERTLEGSGWGTRGRTNWDIYLVYNHQALIKDTPNGHRGGDTTLSERGYPKSVP